jgi:serine/threonine protein phosphatase PrpC
LIRFRYAIRSEVGSLREDNQDAAYADDQVLALADGMGGHPAGDVAASLMIKPFAGLNLEGRTWDVVDHLRAAALSGEDAIAAHVSENPHLDGMGTTLTAVLLKGDRLGLLHVGDSRAYLLRKGILYQLSHDDTLVQSLVDDGILSPEEARFHPQRNVVLRALMGRDTRFGLANVEVREGDWLLLCSDGLSDVLTDEDLTEGLGGDDLEVCAEDLVARALRAGTRDNVTCIVAEAVTTASQSTPAFAGAFIGDA